MKKLFFITVISIFSIIGISACSIDYYDNASISSDGNDVNYEIIDLDAEASIDENDVDFESIEWDYDNIEWHVEDFEQQHSFGYSLGIRNYSMYNLGPILILDAIDDAIAITFNNFGGTDAYFTLKAFLNYEEVRFRVNNSNMDSFATAYTFFLDNLHYRELVINLDPEITIETSSAKLVVMCILEPHLHQYDVANFFDKMYGFQAPSFILLGVDASEQERIIREITVENMMPDGLDWESHINVDEFVTLEKLSDTFYFDFNIADSLENLLDSNFPSHLTVSAGEELSIYFLLGDITGGRIGEFVLIGLENWNQTELTGVGYLPVALPSSQYDGNIRFYPGYGSFRINAPAQQGMHEFIVYAIGIPREVCGFTNIENSFRLTIIVE